MRVLFLLVFIVVIPAETRAEEVVRYRARISAADHHNSRGTRLEKIEQILRQDRANFHKGTNCDPEDHWDPLFAKPENREWLERLATSATIAPALRDFLLHQTPVVEVRITKDSGSGAMKMEVFDVRNLEDPSMKKKEGPKMTFSEVFRGLSFVPGATTDSILAGAHADAPYAPMIPRFLWDDDDIRVMPKKVARGSYAALSHDGKKVLLESAPGVLELWDLETNHLVFSHRLTDGRVVSISRAAEDGWMLVALFARKYWGYIFRIPTIPGHNPECLFSCDVHPERELKHPRFNIESVRPGSKDGELLLEARGYWENAEDGEGKLAKIFPEKGELQLVDHEEIPITRLSHGQAIDSLNVGGGRLARGRLFDRLGSRQLIALTGPDPEWMVEDKWSWGMLVPRWNERERFSIYARDSSESDLRRVGSVSPRVTLQDISPSGSRMLIRLAMPRPDAPQGRIPSIGDWIIGSGWEFDSFSLVEVDLRTLEVTMLVTSADELAGVYSGGGDLILVELEREEARWKLSRFFGGGRNAGPDLYLPVGRFSPRADTSAIREYAPEFFELSFSDIDRCEDLRCANHRGLGGGRYTVSFSLESGNLSKVDKSSCQVISRGARGVSANRVTNAKGLDCLRFDSRIGPGKILTGINVQGYDVEGHVMWSTHDGERYLCRFSPSGNRFFATINEPTNFNPRSRPMQVYDVATSRALIDFDAGSEIEFGIPQGEAFAWHGEDHIILSTERYICSFPVNEEETEPLCLVPNQQGSPPNRAIYDETRGWTGFSRDNAVDFYSLDASHAAVHELSIYFNSSGEVTVVDRDGFFTGHSRDGAACSMVRNGKTFPFEQFDLLKNRPDLILARLGAEESLIEAARVLRSERLRKSGFSEESLGISSDAPEVEILGEVPLTIADSSITIEVSVSSETEELERVMVFSNGVPVHGADGIDLSEQRANRWTGEVTVPLLPGENRIEIRALDGRGTESLAEARSIDSTAGEEPTLYFAALGVSQYRQSEFNLDVAAKDAEDITRFFQEEDSDQWKSVQTLCLTDEQVTKGAIVAVEQFFSQAKPEDVAVLFIAGHGLLDDSYDYYFATSEIDFENPGPTGGLKFDEIESVFYRCAALRKLGLIDTCHAGELVGGTSEEILALLKKNGVRAKELPNLPKKTGVAEISFEERRIVSEFFADLRRGSGATIIAASAGAEFSNEDKDLGNGIFTYLVLKSLKDKEGDENTDGKIDVRELRKYVEVEASRMTGGLQNPSTRRLNFINPFVIAQ